MYFIKVILDKSYNSLFKEYSYLVTEIDYNILNIGSVVEVKFGHATRKAFVIYKGDFNNKRTLKYINKIINSEGLNEYQLDLYNILKTNVIKDEFHIFNQFLKTTDKIENKELNMRQELAYEFIQDGELKDEDALLILDFIKENKVVSKRKLNSFFEVKDSKIKKLIDHGYIQKTKVIYQYKTDIYMQKEENYEKINVFDKLNNKVNLIIPGNKHNLIYQELVYQAILNNEQLLIIVPDVATTYDLFSNIISDYINSAIIINSKTTNKEMQYYDYLIRNNLVNIIIGTKRSLFLPYSNLKTIIIENAHDLNCYNNFLPYYNLIDVFEKLKVDNKILMTNTPNLITYTKAKKNIYNLIEYDKKELNYEITPISDYEQVINVDNLIKIKELISNDQKVLIYYNYQGYASYMKCNKCGSIKTCPRCNKEMRYFQEDNKLVCGNCHYKITNNNTCSICGSIDDFTAGGIGVEKVNEILNNYFADDITFIDAKKIAKITDYKKTLKEIENKHIILATQVITNLNIINDFSYAIIINSDTAYYSYNPYLVEKTFQEISSICSKVNNVSIQTKLSNTHMYDYINNYDMFYQKEMELRQIKKEIPYYNISVINTYYENEDILKFFNQKIQKYFSEKNIICDVMDTQVIFTNKKQYKMTLRIKYKTQDLNLVFENIYNNAIKQKITIEIKDKYNNYF